MVKDITYEYIMQLFINTYIFVSLSLYERRYDICPKINNKIGLMNSYYSFYNLFIFLRFLLV